MDESWFSYCDGSSQHVGSIIKLEYHASLNAVIAVTDNNSLKIFDANSGAILQQSIKELDKYRKLQCKYHNTNGSVAITDGLTIGYRWHNNGVLLLSTALQGPITSLTDVITIELPISEARILSNFIKERKSQILSKASEENEDGNSDKNSVVEGFLNNLINEISNAEESEQSNHKISGKWTTVKVSLVYGSLKTACQILLLSTQRQGPNMDMIPSYPLSLGSAYGLPILSAIMHQLVLLFPSDNPGCTGSVIKSPSRRLMYSELARRATFHGWPHASYKYALPHAMAQAGFFHQSASSGDDRAMCFACNVCLVCWEPSDEPWSEHERHSPTCPFVCCEPTANVPLSVTHATQPAQPNPFTPRNSGDYVPIEYLDLGERSGLLAAATKDGQLAVWDINDLPKLLKVTSIDSSNILNYLKPYLQLDCQDSQKFTVYTLYNLTITSLHVLDKIPPAKDLGTCDPQEFLTGKSKPKDKTDSEEKTIGPSPNFDKLPALVLGITAVVRPKTSEPHTIKEKYGVTGVIKQAPKNGRNAASRDSVIKSISEKKNLVTFSLPGTSSDMDKNVSFEDSAVTSMCNFETTKEYKENLEEEEGGVDGNTYEDMHVEEHIFSLLTFVQIGKCEPEKNTAENSPNNQQNLTESSIHMEIDDDYYDAMATNGVGGMLNSTAIPMYKPGSSVISQDFKMELPDDELVMVCDKMEGSLWEDPFPSILPPLSDFIDDSPTSEEGKALLSANNTPPSDKAVNEEQSTSMIQDYSHILQCVVLDQKINYKNPFTKIGETMTEMESTSQKLSSFQVIRNIISTEDGSRLLVTTSPTKLNSKGAITRVVEDISTTGKNIIPELVSDDNAKLTNAVQGSFVSSEVVTSLDKNEETKSIGEKKEKFFLSLKDNSSTPKNDLELGKLYSFNLEPSNSIYYVSPGKIEDGNKDIKWIETSPLLQLTNLPSDFAGASYEDEDVDSMNGDDGDELKENKREEGVRKTSVLMRDDGVVSFTGKPTYALTLTRAGEIAVINVETLTIAFTVNPSGTFSESGSPINSPITPISGESKTNEVPDIKDVVSDGLPEKFMSFVYCTSTGRLCVSTNKGKLAFIKIGKHMVLPIKTTKTTSMYYCPTSTTALKEVMVDTETQDVADGSHSATGKISSKSLLVNQPLTNKTLKSLLQLTNLLKLRRFMRQTLQSRFDPLRPRFTATAPICWTEVPFDLSLGSANTNQQGSTYHPSQQPDQGYQKSMNQPSSQQQPYRRHLLHPIQHYTSDMTFHTRAWKLQQDCTSWNDHLFELVFPRQTNLSHIDFKFVLTGKLEQGTDIQISLLKHPGLTTSKNELLCREQKKKWRHHVKHIDSNKTKRSLTVEMEDLFSFFKPMLTENVAATMDGPRLLVNPVLLVAQQRRISGSMKEFLLLDGNKHEIVAMIRESLNVEVGQLIMLIGYTTCQVGSSGIRIIVTALNVVNIPVLVPTTSDDNGVDSADAKTEKVNLSQDTDKEITNIDEPADFAPPPYASLKEAPPTTDSSANEDSEDAINKDGSSILFGPVSLSNYVDGTGIGGIVTMASMKLLRDSRHRAVLVHIKDASKKTRKLGSATSSDEWARKGCNCLQEISMTVYKILRTEISHERMQRVSLLQSRSLQTKLYEGLSGKQDGNCTDENTINMKSLPVRITCLKILNWIAAIESVDPKERTNPSFVPSSSRKDDAGSSKTSENEQEESFIHRSLTSIISSHKIKDESHDASVYCLSGFLKKCFMESPRDVAILALKLMFQTALKFDIEGDCVEDRNICSRILTNSLLNCLVESTSIKVESAFGMNCLFQLLTVALLSMKEEMNSEDDFFNSTLNRCRIILCEAASKMNGLTSPLHSVLRSSYGLYGTPFDPECFVVDGATELPNIKSKPFFGTGANERLVKQQTWERYFSKQELNVYDLIMPKILDTRRSLAVVDLLDGRSVSKIGLIECRPLHFTCVDASEGCSVDFENDSSAQFQIQQHANQTSSGLLISDNQSSMRTTILQKLKEAKILSNEAIWNIEFEEHQSNSQRETAVESIHKRVQQELFATKRHFISSDKPETSGKEDTSSNEQVQPVTMNFPNLTFNLPRTSFLTISRMHSGARRSVVLDFGSVMEITDVHIPSCPDLSSLTLDAWSNGSKDGPLNTSLMTHVGMTLDICDHNFILGNLMPPIVCRYIKITVIGRYGTTNAESQLHLGHFYGRPLCLSQRVSTNHDPCSSVPSPPKKSMKELEEECRVGDDRRSEVVDLLDVCYDSAGRAAVTRSINYLRAYQDDVECRYGLACCQLRACLTDDTAQASETSADMREYFMDNYRSTLGFIGHKNKANMDKVMYVYDKCIQLQTQLTRVTSAIRYMDSILGITESPVSPFNEPSKNTASYDQLQVFCELMINTMLVFPDVSSCTLFSPIATDPPVDLKDTDLFDLPACAEIFKNICSHANPRLRMRATCLLLSYCSSYNWWGQFLSGILVDSLGGRAHWSEIRELPKEHVFSLLLVLGQRSLVVPQKAENVIESLLKLVESNLSPFNCDLESDENINNNFLNLITWLFLYITHLVETVLSHNDNFVAYSVPPPTFNNDIPTVNVKTPASTSNKDFSEYLSPPKQLNSNDKGSQEGDTSDSKSKTSEYQEYSKATLQHLPPPPSTPSNQNTSGSTRESRFKSRWDYLSLSDQNSITGKRTTGSAYLKIINTMKGMRDQLKYHKQELKKLNKLKKELQETLAKPVNSLKKEEIYSQYETLGKLKDLKAEASKHMRGIMSYRRRLDRKTFRLKLTKIKPDPAVNVSFLHGFIGVSMKTCKAVVRGILKFLLYLDFTVPSDLIVLACKLASQLCRWSSCQSIYLSNLNKNCKSGKAESVHPLHLSDLVSADDLRKILVLAVGGTSSKLDGAVGEPDIKHSCGAWVNHAMFGLLQDIIECENNAVTKSYKELYGDSDASSASKEQKETDDLKIEDLTSSDDQAKYCQEDEDSNQGGGGVLDISEAMELVESKDDEYKKRMTLVNTFITSVEEMMNDVRVHMKAIGEYINEDGEVEQIKGEVSSFAANLDEEPTTGQKASWFKSIQKFLGTPEDKQGTSTTISAVGTSNATQSKRLVQAQSFSGWLNNSNDHLPGAPENDPVKTSLQSAQVASINVSRSRVNSVSGSTRSLLCTQAYDCRPVHGILQHVQLQLKLCATASLKYVAKCVSFPPMSVPQDEQNDKKLKETSNEDMETSSSPLSSFRMIRSCFLDLFRDWSSYSIPLTTLCELLLLMQTTYEETLFFNVVQLEEDESQTLLSLDGIKVLLPALNETHISNPKTWKLAMDLINFSLRTGKNTTPNNKRFLETLLSPEMGFWNFLRQMLSSKLTATNITGSFHQMLPIFGPTMVSTFGVMLTMIKSSVDLTQNLSLLRSYRDELLHAVYALASTGQFDHTSNTPTDAQLLLIGALSYLLQPPVRTLIMDPDMNLCMSTVRYITNMTKSYLQWCMTAAKRKSDHSLADPRSCMTGIFSNVMRPMTSGGKIQESPKDHILFMLLDLCKLLVTSRYPYSTVEEDACSPGSASMMETDDRKEECMDVDMESSEEKPVKMDIPESDIWKSMAVFVLQDEQIMTSLFTCLSMCNSCTMASFFNGLSISPQSVINNCPMTVGDGVSSLLSTISSSISTDRELPVQAILRYLTSNRLNEDGKYVSSKTSVSPTCQISRPLLWYILSVLEPSPNAELFCQNGGARLIADSLVASSRETVDLSPNKTSQVLRYLSAADNRAAALAPRAPVTLQSDVAWPALPSKVQKISGVMGHGFNYPGVASSTIAGMQPIPNEVVLGVGSLETENKKFNFASVGSTFTSIFSWNPATIECSDTTALSADTLLKPKVMHRRTRSPSWSYHFSSGRQWVSLTLHFPNAFVLKEVQLTPMLMSLSTTPSSVMLETNRTGSPHVSSYHPVSVPVTTCGLNEILIQPPSDEVVTSIRIHMKKPVDSTSIGLTRIIVNGVSNFMNYHSRTSDFPPKISAQASFAEDVSKRSTLNWLSILYRCMTVDDSLSPLFCEVIAEVDGLIPTLCALLQLRKSTMFTSIVKAVLIQIGTFDLPNRVTELMYCLLSAKDSINLGFLGSAQEAASESSIDILYSLGQKMDKHFGLRIEKMLEWVRECAVLYGGSQNFVCFASHIHTIACVLWSSFSMDDVKKNISLELVHHCYQWSQKLESTDSSPMTSRVDSPLKRSLDWLLCSFCLVHIEYFEQILNWMDIKVNESGQQNNVFLTSVKLKTLAVVSQTSGCLQILKSKGILLALSNGIAFFCHLVLQMYNVSIELDVSTESVFTINPDNVIAAVNFFSEICQWRCIQDWLGTTKGRRSWISLFQMLCYILPLTNQYGVYTSASRIPRYLLLELQESTIRFLKSVTNSHYGNQRLFTKALCDILNSQAGTSKSGGAQLTGFVRSLLLRVVLEDEQYTIHLVFGTGQKFHKGKSNSCVSGGTLPCHPKFGTGHFKRTFKIGISSTVLDIRAVVTDAPLLVSKLQKQKSLLKKTQHTESESAGSDKKSTSKISNIGVIMSSLQKKKMNKMVAKVAGKEGTIASSILKGVFEAGKTAQMKRSSKVIEEEDVPSSIQESLESLSLKHMPVITLTCSDLQYEALDQNVTLLQLLAKQKDLEIESDGTYLSLEMNLTKYTKLTNDKAAVDKNDTASMESQPSSSEIEGVGEAEDSEKKTEVIEQPGSSKPKDSLLDCKPMKTMLEVFASLGGLGLAAAHLPMTTLELLHPDVGTSEIKSSMPTPPIMSMPYMQPPSHWCGVQTSMPMWMATDEEDIFGFEDEFIDYDDIEPVYSSFPLNVKKTGPSTSGPKKQPAKCTVVGNNNHPCIPSHTMSALCLFLRVPFFAEEFLKQQRNARCLLRLMLGVLDDGQGDPILKLDLAKSLPMLPFNAIQTLLSHYGPRSTPGQAIRFSMTFDTTSFHLILACISRFTHFEPDHESSAGRLLASLLPEVEPAQINVAPPSYKRPVQPPKTEDNNNNSQQSEKFYWAKGTGFGTGSTTSDWDVEHAVKKQKQDEEYITVLFEVLANFVCPETPPSEQSESQVADQESSQENSLILEGSLETIIPELLVVSGVLPAIASYLRNDSVLDMARHVPLYRSLLRVIRAFAVCPVLCRLLMDRTATSRQPAEGSKETSSCSDSVLTLLSKMRKCVDTYARRLKVINVSLNRQGEQGLSFFVSDVQKTETLLKKIATEIKSKEEAEEGSSGISSSPDAKKKATTKMKLSSESLEKRYIEEIKQLQFDTFELVVEDDDGKLKFPCGHHYASHIKEASNVTDAGRARRLAQESVTLSNSLPLSHSSTVFVRCDEERLDVMKVLMTGPSDTPYANGCFEFDVFFPADYNTSPPYVNLLTTGNHSIRFNPNLYNDGKVCLSILNTWHGRPEEKWNPQTSSFLQILVSIQSLILVSEPYFNEPGYERSRGTMAGKQSSREYNANIRQATVKWAMLEQLKSPSPCFKEVIERHFWLKRTEVLNQCNTWLTEMKQQASDRHGRRTIAHNYTALQRHVDQFKELLMKMKCPEGLEDIEEEGKSDAENNSLNYNVEITLLDQDESKDVNKSETNA